MKRVCAWCNRPMDPVDKGGKASANLVTHSICSECSDNLDFQLGVPLKSYLDSLNIPIIALDGTGATIGINAAALKLGKEKNPVTSAEWPGTVFECAHARLPEGCKRTVHCSGCAIRIVATESFATGEGRHDVPAHLNHCSSNPDEKVDLLISADSIDGIVFLRIVSL